MKIKRFGLFKSVNVFMAVFCTGAMVYNYCGVNVLTQDTAQSDYKGNSYSYKIQDDSFCISKNGQSLGNLKSEKKLEFQKSVLPNLNCNAAATAPAAAIAAALQFKLGKTLF